MFKSYILPLFVGLSLLSCAPHHASAPPPPPNKEMSVPVKPEASPKEELKSYSGTGWSMQLPASFAERKDPRFELKAFDEKRNSGVILYTTEYPGTLGSYLTSSLLEVREAGLQIGALEKRMLGDRPVVYVEVLNEDRRAGHWVALVNGRLFNFGCLTPNENLEANKLMCQKMVDTLKISVELPKKSLKK